MASRRSGSTNVRDEVGLKGPAKKPNFAPPEGYADIPTFLSDMRKEFYHDINYDKLNRDAAIEDLKFLVGDQWDDMTRMRRLAARKPVLTVNRIPAFVAQVIGSRRMNETTIKILPDNGGTKDIATVREGIIRSIVKLSHGERAFDKASDGSVMCGIGNFQIEMDYESEEVFDQVLKITPINDHLATVWDRMMTDPTGRDASHVFVIDNLKSSAFKKRWPWATASDVVVDTMLRGDLRMNGWIAVDDVRVVSYWRMLTKRRTIALMQDEKVVDITDELAGEDEDAKFNVLSKIQQRRDGTPIMREVNKKYAQMYLCSGLDILEGPYNLDISRVPVIRVPGWELNIAEWKHRWGLVRFAKDPQRLHNFWRSVVAEKLMQSPRAVWKASSAAVEGREAEWRNSHLSDDPLLIYNAEAASAPERVPPAELEQALISEAEMTTQDMKDVTNIHEANLGMPSNEVSGAAIIARQRVSDTGTIIYQDNIEAAIEEAGWVLNELIPVCYDTPRTVRVVDADGREALQRINYDGDDSVDLGTGDYSVTVKTAPSTATKRIEAAQSMMAFINAAPQVAAYTMDLVAESMDWPKHEEFARRIRVTLPPGMVNPKDMTPEERQNAMNAQQMQAQQAQMVFHTALANYLKTQSEATLNNARAEHFNTQTELAPVTAQNQATDTASRAAEREARVGMDAVRLADGK